MVRKHRVKNRASNRWQLTRRELLSTAGATALGLFAGSRGTFGQSTRPTASRPRAGRLVDTPWWLERRGPRARVVDIRSGDVLHASGVARTILGEMLDRGIRDLTGAASPETAWRTVLGSAERIALKFNSVGDDVINTNGALARVLVDRIAAAGYAPEQIALADVPDFLKRELGTRPVTRGWGSAIPVGDGLEPLAQYLYEADAIINVALLKTHRIAGMSGCLKNLSHALIRHPAWYHGNRCSPYVGQVVGSKEVSSRLRLNITNAVRVVVNRGPDARPEDIIGYGGLLLGFDPVAVDNVGLSILAVERRRRELTAPLGVRYLATAAEMGLGRCRPADIERIALEVDA
jgi:hypothetical protein